MNDEPKRTGPLRAAFVPKPLEVPERPELIAFPRNLLIVNFTTREGVPCIARAVYDPNLESYQEADGQHQLTYLNQYGAECQINLSYQVADGAYTVEKFVTGKQVLFAYGHDWKDLFVTFTGNGLHQGEACFFEPISAEYRLG
ncbi:hypothetical protein HY346_02015 [Candidatus Microgenomates bacterium]|nr:hypothetical protein [Candidatus Microgenomates bacterium]